MNRYFFDPNFQAMTYLFPHGGNMVPNLMVPPGCVNFVHFANMKLLTSLQNIYIYILFKVHTKIFYILSTS